MPSDRFARFLPLAGVLAGLIFLTGLIVFRNDPPSESDVAATFDYWRDDQGQHQIVALILTPLMGFLLIFFGSDSSADSSTGVVTRGTGPSRSAEPSSQPHLRVGWDARGRDDERGRRWNREAVYTLNQLHSYDWLAWNAAFAALLLATGLDGALRNGMFPKLLAWATVVIGATLLTPLGFFGFILLPLWLVVSGVWLTFRDRAVLRPAATSSI